MVGKAENDEGVSGAGGQADQFQSFSLALV